MSKTFRPWKIEEPLLLPVTVADFVAERHLARFVLSVVRDEVDLGKIAGTYGSEQHILQTLVCYRLIDPGSEWRLHRQCHKVGERRDGLA